MKERLIGNRVYLEYPAGKVSAEEICECMSCKNTARYMYAVPYPYTIDNASMFLKFVERTEIDYTTFQFGIFNKQDECFIGMISLENIDYECRKCEIGFWISEKFVGKGFAKESSQLLIDYAFAKLAMNKIAAFAIKENVASISLLMSLGFEIEGLFRDDVINKGQLVDRYAFGLLRDNKKMAATINGAFE
jgi:ribosomal-protein-serine acetyltransferase